MKAKSLYQIINGHLYLIDLRMVVDCVRVGVIDTYDGEEVGSFLLNTENRPNQGLPDLIEALYLDDEYDEQEVSTNLTYLAHFGRELIGGLSC